MSVLMFVLGMMSGTLVGVLVILPLNLAGQGPE